MSRSVWKPLYRDISFERFPSKINEKEPCFSSRSILLIEDLLGQSLLVHNGRRFTEITVELEHLGHRAGEFAATHLKPKIARKKNIKKKW